MLASVHTFLLAAGAEVKVGANGTMKTRSTDRLDVAAITRVTVVDSERGRIGAQFQQGVMGWVDVLFLTCPTKIEIGAFGTVVSNSGDSCIAIVTDVTRKGHLQHLFRHGFDLLFLLQFQGWLDSWLDFDFRFNSWLRALLL
jgi:hypothetical protein